MQDNSPIIQCPYCGVQVLIEQINCAIFRHGIFKSNGEQINPHTPKVECDRLFEKNQIYGCGKPFKLVKDISNNWIAEICDYI
jgi:hypothetical protein